MALFGGLSISSVNSSICDEHANNFLNVTELQKRIQELENLTSKLLLPKSISLSLEYDSFADVDTEGERSFEIFVDSLSAVDVLCITILSNSVFDCGDSTDDLLKLRFCELEEKGNTNVVDLTTASMIPSPTHIITKSGSEYSYTISADLLKPKTGYVLHVRNVSPNSQSLKICARKHAAAVITQTVTHSAMAAPHVSFADVNGTQSVHGVGAGANNVIHNCVSAGQYQHYAYQWTDRSRMLSIRVSPRAPLDDSSVGIIGDPDVYVSNRHMGLVGASQQQHIWSSSTTDRERIDIHPALDTHASLGEVFIISIYGNRENNPYSLEVCLCPLPTVTTIKLPAVSPHTQDGDVSTTSIEVSPHSYQYFVLPISPPVQSYNNPSYSGYSDLEAGKLMMEVTVTEAHFCESRVTPGLSTVGDGKEDGKVKCSVGGVENAEQHRDETPSGAVGYGHATYVTDELPIWWPLQELRQAQANFSSMSTTAPASPHSLSQDAMQGQPTLLPVLHMSQHYKYPDSSYFTWKGSNLDGHISVMFEIAEWSLSPAGQCYFSIAGVPLPAADGSPAQEQLTAPRLNCDIKVKYVSELTNVSDSVADIHGILSNVYKQVDGNALSQTERLQIKPSYDSLKMLDRSDGGAKPLNINGECSSLTYGEIEFLPFTHLLQDIHSLYPQTGGVFYDLGCGTGKAVATAALCDVCEYSQCVGVELLPGLAASASDMLVTVEEAVSKANFTRGQHHRRITTAPMSIREGSLVDLDWTDATFIYVSSLCFPDALVEQFLQCCQSLKKGTIIASLTRLEYDASSAYRHTNRSGKQGNKGPGPGGLTRLHQASYRMSWGKMPVYFFVKE